MLTFAEFLGNAASNREFVNVLFEGRVFELIGPFRSCPGRWNKPVCRTNWWGARGIPPRRERRFYPLVADSRYRHHDPTRGSTSRCRDRRGTWLPFPAFGGIGHVTLRRDKECAQRGSSAFRRRESRGEKVKDGQIEAHPAIRPVRTGLHGHGFLVIPVVDLVRTKLSSFRDKDRVHVRGMDAAGLFTHSVEQELGEELRARLRHVRETE